MTPTLLPPLRRVAISTFEDLALIMREAEPEGDAPRPPYTQAARVAFAGPRSGYVDLRASQGVIVAAARNMLADDDPAPHFHFDTLAELTNVICGNLVPELASPDDTYHLKAPAPTPVDPAPASDACVELSMEGGRVEIRLVLHAVPAPVPA